eukprot:scaffold73_cov252-Pinguiococcus_pyrenoidosus.AAC.29
MSCGKSKRSQWLTPRPQDGSKVLAKAGDSSKAHWKDFDQGKMSDRVRLLNDLSLLSYGPVSVQGRVSLSTPVSSPFPP